MKKFLFAAVLALGVSGCASDGRVIHNPGVFGDPVGSITAIEDPVSGAVIYKMVEGTGRSQMWLILPKDSKYTGGR